MPLSATISTGLVKGRFGSGVVAGPNGEKLLVPARGRIDFVGMTPFSSFPLATPDPVTMLRPTGSGILDSEGYLCTPDPADKDKPGERMVLLQADNDPDSTVQGWTWRATLRFVNADGTRVHNTLDTMTFDLPFGDVPFDLAHAVDVPESVGIGTEQAIILAASAQAHAASADAAAEAALGVAREIAGTVAGKADLIDGKVPADQLPPAVGVTDEVVAPLVDMPETAAKIDARVAGQVAGKLDADTAAVTFQTKTDAAGLPARLGDATTAEGRVLAAAFAPKGRARLTVAASDSAPLMKALADYVCTGVGDLAVMQAAQDALPDDNAVSGEFELLPGNFRDATDFTLSIGSPSSGAMNPRKVMRFHRGARINVSGRTGRKAVIKVESPDCQIINPNIAGNIAFGNGTGIAIGGDVATLGGRWNRVCNRVRINNPIISNCETAIEFSSIDGGPGVGGSTGDCIVDGGYIFQNKTAIRAAGYVNTIIAPTLANNNTAIWVEPRRVEAQLRSYGTTIVGWNEVGIKVDGGFGSVFHDTWMEHVSADNSVATEAIRLGLDSANRANLTRFTGTTMLQLVTEQYGIRYVGAVDTEVENLVISTSGAKPSVAIVRNELPSTSKNNRIRRVTFGPNAIPAHTTLSIDAAAWGDVFIDRVPAATGSTAFSTRMNPSTRASSSPAVRKTVDTSRTTDILAPDPDMTISLTPATVYALTGLVIFDATQASDFKMQFNVSSGGTVQWAGVGPASSSTSPSGVASVTTQQATSGFVQAWGGASAGAPIAVPITGIVKTGDLASLTMSWAQNTADATATILKNGSWLRLEPLP